MTKDDKVVTLAIVGAPAEDKYRDIVLQWLQENKPNGRLDLICSDNGDLTLCDLIYLALLWDENIEVGVRYVRGCKDAQHLRKKIDDLSDYIIFFFNENDQFCRQWINMRRSEEKHGTVFRIS